MNVNSDPSLSLLSALRPNSAANRNGNTNANTNAGAGAQTASSTPLDILAKPKRTSLPPSATATAPTDLTIDGLLEAWGGKSEMYDLNGDGDVGMGDLVNLLKSMRDSSRAPTEIQPVDADPKTESPPTNLLATLEPETPGYDLASTVKVSEPTQLADLVPDPVPNSLTEPVTDPVPTQLADPVAEVVPTQLAPPQDDPVESDRMRLKELLAAWGTDAPEFDLNADGTVNMADVISLLRGEDAPPSTGTDLVSDNPMTLRGLLEQWGQSGSRYDLDQDGTVNMRDLVTMLGKMVESRRDSPAGHLVEDSGERTRRSSLRGIASSLAGRLRENGFGAHPPSNVHDLVQSLNLAPGHQSEFMKYLDAEFPAGLGVNLVG